MKFPLSTCGTIKEIFMRGNPEKESNEYLQHLPKGMQNRKEALC